MNNAIPVLLVSVLDLLFSKPDSSCHCGAHVGYHVSHGMSCTKSKSHHYPYWIVNVVIWRDLFSLRISYHFESLGLYHSKNGKDLCI